MKSDYTTNSCYTSLIQSLFERLGEYTKTQWQVFTLTFYWVSTIKPCTETTGPFTPKFKKYNYSLNFLQRLCMGKVVRIARILIVHQSKLWKDKFSILCDVIFLARLQGKYDIDHSWEWKGWSWNLHCKLLAGIPYLDSWSEGVGLECHRIGRGQLHSR